MKYISIFLIITTFGISANSEESINDKNCKIEKIKFTENCEFNIPALENREKILVNNDFDDISYFIGAIEVECIRGKIYINKKTCRKLNNNCYQEKTKDKLISNFASFDKEKNIICY